MNKNVSTYTQKINQHRLHADKRPRTLNTTVASVNAYFATVVYHPAGGMTGAGDECMYHASGVGHMPIPMPMPCVPVPIPGAIPGDGLTGGTRGA